MNPEVEAKLSGVSQLCERYHVQTLELFGSGTGPAFDSSRSDLDFLVVFRPCTPAEHYDRFFGLLESLEALLGLRVDLVEANVMKNPYLIRQVNESRIPLYAA